MTRLQETPAYLMAQKVINFERDKDRVFQQALDSQKIKDLIVFLQTESQFGTAHVDSKGVGLFNTQTGRSTYAESDPLGRGGEPYEVFRTGDYWESFVVNVLVGEIDFQGNPIKSGGANLFEIYGSDLEGLTEESLEVLIREALIAHINFIRFELRI